MPSVINTGEANALFFSTATNFFDDDIHQDMPNDIIQINAEQHQQLLAALNNGARIMADLSINPRPSELHQWYELGQAWVLPEDALAEALQQAKDKKLQQLNSTAQAYINKASGADKLPEFEIQTWVIQGHEAKAWHTDPTVPTPTLDKIAAARGISPDLLKRKAYEKTIKFEELTANVVGLRQAIETKIKQANTLPELDAITFGFGDA